METTETTQKQEEMRDDRRDALRQSCLIDTLLVEHPTMGQIVCQVMDISRRGLRLRMAINIPCGSDVILHPPKGVELSRSRARIMRQQVVDAPDGTTFFECGLRFTEEAELRRHKWFLTLRKAA